MTISSSPAPWTVIVITSLGPAACIHSGPEIDFTIPAYAPGEYAKAPGTLFFGYEIQTAGAVERNAYGAELIETTSISGNATVELNRENLLAVWDKTQTVTQTIGVPFLSSIPILKYIFGTTTTSEERTKLYMTLRAEILDTASSTETAGVLTRLK